MSYEQQDTPNFNTVAQHGGQKSDSLTHARAVPIYQTTSYEFESPEHAASLFQMQEEGYIYSRNANPTNRVFEKRLAGLEGGVDAFAVSSGQSAITIALLTIAKAGDEIVTTNALYGGTYNLFSETFTRFGITVRFVDGTNIEEVTGAINEKTKAVFTESIGNPGLQIADIKALSKTAHDYGIPLIVDATFTTPYLQKPIEYGADIVVHSATKFIGGNGTAIGGIMIDAGSFNWSNGNFPEFTTPNRALNNQSYVELSSASPFIAKARFELGHNLGTALSPFHGWLFIQGLQSLSVRMRQHVENAKEIAAYLANHHLIAWVNYPALEGDSQYEIAKIYLPKGAGSIFTFGVKGGYESAKTFINSVKLLSHVANVGDSKTLVIHPASTTHARLSPEEKLAAGVEEEQIRLSIGLEDVDDIKADIDQALQKTVGASLVE
ncbi:O-acetylhomoserine aminocarboxypropyltransferase/cysteine synthase family protein [Oceanobacillus sojae]|uniref:O-acetylhomoserine aminocarboxypropyltransferase/cysteine synthase family protein n=1 Tax=Oceanobacillus sojae TaxID=582851 RepID=UPI0021A5B9EE|nr:O-acetylhomoserine aminocarboxypropyltransferase/cysteine synthase family protein [Oceanobacillus sojae]MCT1902570.1 O-acetylhomoserine aminocarboxypropyltransferase/cysteine synthase [Oceanobacillus sojae]